MERVITATATCYVERLRAESGSMDPPVCPGYLNKRGKRERERGVREGREKERERSGGGGRGKKRDRNKHSYRGRHRCTEQGLHRVAFTETHNHGLVPTDRCKIRQNSFNVRVFKSTEYSYTRRRTSGAVRERITETEGDRGRKK